MFYSILAGLGIGLFGSFHCVGMCGPIALSLPIYGKSKVEKLFLILLYNLGRASTYAAFGALFGFMGKQFWLFGYQRAFSVLLGVSILVLLFVSKFLHGKSGMIEAVLIRIKASLASLLKSPSNSLSYYFIGLVNGLLPCGLVYLAVGSAMATGNAFSGAALMFMFGLGTFPLMISLMIFGRFISLSFRNRMRRLVPVFITVTALVIMLRGMNLGIPYLSPQLSETEQLQQIKCHK
ncbi:MAG: sulfite exporter TauE/SafE family protein [Bacteroidota bacterium]